MKRAVLIGFGVIAVTWTYAAAGGGSASVVDVKARLEPAVAGKSVVVFTLDIKSGWHLYANPVNHDDDTLKRGQVVVNGVDVDAKINYPAGVPYVDMYGEKYSVYQKKVEIRAAVDRVIDAAHPVDFTIKLQSCDGKKCLPGATVRVTVP